MSKFRDAIVELLAAEAEAAETGRRLNEARRAADDANTRLANARIGASCDAPRRGGIYDVGIPGYVAEVDLAYGMTRVEVRKVLPGANLSAPLED